MMAKVSLFHFIMQVLKYNLNYGSTKANIADMEYHTLCIFCICTSLTTRRIVVCDNIELSTTLNHKRIVMVILQLFLKFLMLYVTC